MLRTAQKGTAAGATSRALEIGAKVRALRSARGLSQMKLAALCGVNPMTITKVELAGVITFRTAKRLGAVLGVDPTTLVTVE